MIEIYFINFKRFRSSPYCRTLLEKSNLNISRNVFYQKAFLGALSSEITHQTSYKQDC
jgi:hypothetical protein